MANPYKGGEFELVEATLILSTGTPIKLTAGSVLSIAIFEDIYQYSLVGSMVIQDAMNLGSLGTYWCRKYY